MSQILHARIPTGAWLLFLNAILLCTNVGFLILFFKSQLFANRHSIAQASHTATHEQMDLAFVKDPLTLLVDKQFPRKDTFRLFDEKQPMLIIADDADRNCHREATRKLAVVLGDDFEVDCFYSLDKGIGVHELLLTTGNKFFLDMNADGVYDVRLVRTQDSDDHSPEMQVWYNDQWRDAVSEPLWGKYKRTLRDGSVIEFDMKSGSWLSSKDENHVDVRSNS